MTVQETLTKGKRLLASPCPSALIDTPALDAALLLSCILQTGRAELIVRGNESISEPDRENFFRLIERRRSGECAAYILGRKEFRGLDFTVNPHVLVPRPDTETIVEAALEAIDSTTIESMGENRNCSLLDLCTGSGALAISLKNERPFLDLTATDISPKALETAALNAARLLDDRFSDGRLLDGWLRFIQSDLFENVSGRFDIIVANPPYVPSREIDSLPPEVRREPRLALDGGNDGLNLIRRIISAAPAYLLPGGVLLLEAAPEQMPAIRTLMENNCFGSISIRRDLAGQERVISGKH